MGGEGSMAHANQSLKQNRSQLRKRKYKDRKDLLLSYSGKTVLEFKKIPPEELNQIKEEIRRRAKKEQKKLIVTVFVSILITALIFFLIFI